jgi:hypothetical protein
MPRVRRQCPDSPGMLAPRLGGRFRTARRASTGMWRPARFSALPHVAWGFMRAGNGLAGSRRRHALGWRGRSQGKGCRGGFGAGSRCMGVCAGRCAARRTGCRTPVPMAHSSDRTSAALNAIAINSRIAKYRSRSAVGGLSGNDIPPRHARMGSARFSTRNPARTMAFKTVPRRLVARIHCPVTRTWIAGMVETFTIPRPEWRRRREGYGWRWHCVCSYYVLTAGLGSEARIVVGSIVATTHRVARSIRRSGLLLRASAPPR